MIEKISSFPTILLVASLLSIGLSGAGADEDTGKPARRTYLRRTESAPGKTLYLEVKNADLSIRGGEGDEIAVEAEVELSGLKPERLKEILQATELVLEPYGEGFRMALKIPGLERTGQEQGGESIGFLRRMFYYDEFEEEKLSVSSLLEIQVPSRHSLEIDDEFGDIQIEQVDGALRIYNHSGEVAVRRSRGSLQLHNSYGPIEVAGFAGRVSIQGSHCPVWLRDIRGDAEVRTSYKPVRLENIGGALKVEAQYSEVEGRGIQGDCRITSSYKPVEVDQIGGSLEISGSYSPVTARNVERNAVILSSYKPIVAEKIEGDVEIDNGYGSVKVEQVGGKVEIKNSYKPVEVEGVRGSLEIRGTYSPISAREIGGDLTIRSSYKSITVEKTGGRVKIDGEYCGVSVDGVRGDVDISNSYRKVVVRGSSGSISVRGNSSPIEVSRIERLEEGGRIELFTTVKPVELLLPENPDIRASLRTHSGKIRSDFPLVPDESTDRRARIELGRGSTLIQIETDGDITLGKE